MRRRKHGLRLGLLAAVAVAAAGLSVTAYALDLLRPLELNTVDARYRIRGTRAPPKGVVLVALDARSLRELGRRPPLPRSLHARLLDQLHRDHPRLIVYDFQFTGHTTSREDRALVEAV
ncbi:MAG: adenylate cyclase, partial [Solirubrobacteraceae bacterium]|nr:adenylate cyclase [Solirubrobacteraceae bacterium]